MQFKFHFLSLLASISMVHAVAIPSPLVYPSPEQLSLCVSKAAALLTTLVQTVRLQDVGFSWVDYSVCAACYTQAFSKVIVSQTVFQDPKSPDEFAKSVRDCHP